MLQAKYAQFPKAFNGSKSHFFMLDCWKTQIIIPLKLLIFRWTQQVIWSYLKKWLSVLQSWIEQDLLDTIKQLSKSTRQTWEESQVTIILMSRLWATLWLISNHTPKKTCFFSTLHKLTNSNNLTLARKNMKSWRCW